MLDVLEVTHIATRADDSVRSNGVKTLDILESSERPIGSLRGGMISLDISFYANDTAHQDYRPPVSRRP